MNQPKQDQPVRNMSRTTLVTTNELAEIDGVSPAAIQARAHTGRITCQGITLRRSADRLSRRRHVLYEVDGEDLLKAETDTATAAAMIGVSVDVIHSWAASGRIQPLRTDDTTPIYEAKTVVKAAIACGYLPDLREQQDTYCCVSHCGEVAWRDEYIPVCWRHAIVVWLHVNDAWKANAPRRPETTSARVHPPIVYFVQAGDRIKIGTSTNLPRRLQVLRATASYPIELLLVVPGDRTEEKQAHELFREDRRYGEWFAVSPRLLEFIAEREQLDVRHTAGHVDIT